MINKVDIGSLRVPGSYFLLRKDRKSAPFTKRLKSKDDTYGFCYTYRDSDYVIKNKLLKMLNEAERKIFIASFRIGDPELIDALYMAVERLHGGVYIITALDEKSLARGLAEIEDSDEVDIQAQNKRFEEMTRRGIYVRGHSECHAKFAVVDDKIALVSSANLESRAFTKTGECGVVLTDSVEVSRLARFFTHLWYSGCEWEAPPGAVYTVQRRRPSVCPCSVPLPDNEDAIGVIWTNQEEHFILRAIHNIIEKAKKDLVLLTFSLNGIKDNPSILLDPLVSAMKKNSKLRVRLLLRARNHISAHRCDAEALADIGVEIYADSQNHAKGVIADGKYGALFSANFDAGHGILNGVEVGVVLHRKAALKDAVKYFEHAIKYSDLEFVSLPTQKEMSKALGARWIAPWHYGDKLEIICNPEEWNLFSSAAEKAPVLFTRDNDAKVYIIAAKWRWKLKRLNNLQWHLQLNGEEREHTNIIMDRWLKQNQKSSQGCERGFCSALFVFKN